MESSDILLVGTIPGFSREATAKKEMEFTENFFLRGQRDRNRLLVSLNGYQ